MPRAVNPETKTKLMQRLERVQRQIRAHNAAEKNQARSDDARRKIIAGALALEHLAKNPGSEFGKTMFRLLDEYARPDDRRLFEFLSVRDAAPPALAVATVAAAVDAPRPNIPSVAAVGASGPPQVRRAMREALPLALSGIFKQGNG